MTTEDKRKEDKRKGNGGSRKGAGRKNGSIVDIALLERTYLIYQKGLGKKYNDITDFLNHVDSNPLTIKDRHNFKTTVDKKEKGEKLGRKVETTPRNCKTEGIKMHVKPLLLQYLYTTYTVTNEKVNLKDLTRKAEEIAKTYPYKFKFKFGKDWLKSDILKTPPTLQVEQNNINTISSSTAPTQPFKDILMEKPKKTTKTLNTKQGTIITLPTAMVGTPAVAAAYARESTINAMDDQSESISINSTDSNNDFDADDLKINSTKYLEHVQQLKKKPDINESESITINSTDCNNDFHADDVDPTAIIEQYEEVNDDQPPVELSNVDSQANFKTTGLNEDDGIENLVEENKNDNEHIHTSYSRRFTMFPLNLRARTANNTKSTTTTATTTRPASNNEAGSTICDELEPEDIDPDEDWDSVKKKLYFMGWEYDYHKIGPVQDYVWLKPGSTFKNGVKNQDYFDDEGLKIFAKENLGWNYDSSKKRKRNAVNYDEGNHIVGAARATKKATRTRTDDEVATASMLLFSMKDDEKCSPVKNEKPRRSVRNAVRNAKKDKEKGGSVINAKKDKEKSGRVINENTAFEGKYNNIMKLQCVHAI